VNPLPRLLLERETIQTIYEADFVVAPFFLVECNFMTLFSLTHACADLPGDKPADRPASMLRPDPRSISGIGCSLEFARVAPSPVT